jgi:hypothetical protein
LTLISSPDFFVAKYNLATALHALKAIYMFNKKVDKSLEAFKYLIPVIFTSITELNITGSCKQRFEKAKEILTELRSEVRCPFTAMKCEN